MNRNLIKICNLFLPVFCFWVLIPLKNLHAQNWAFLPQWQNNLLVQNNGTSDSLGRKVLMINPRDSKQPIFFSDQFGLNNNEQVYAIETINGLVCYVNDTIPDTFGLVYAPFTIPRNAPVGAAQQFTIRYSSSDHDFRDSLRLRIELLSADTFSFVNIIDSVKVFELFVWNSVYPMLSKSKMILSKSRGILMCNPANHLFFPDGSNGISYFIAGIKGSNLTLGLQRKAIMADYPIKPGMLYGWKTTITDEKIPSSNGVSIDTKKIQTIKVDSNQYKIDLYATYYSSPVLMRNETEYIYPGDIDSAINRWSLFANLRPFALGIDLNRQDFIVQVYLNEKNHFVYSISDNPYQSRFIPFNQVLFESDRGFYYSYHEYHHPTSFIDKHTEKRELKGVQWPLGVPVISENNAGVYPNPATEVVRVLSDITDAGAEYEIINLLGATVQNGTLNSSKIIDIAHLKPGGYLLRFPNRGTFVRFVKQ